ncbi:cap-specific mRNA (nucleoside-2'-O-)-methyltransferase 1 isoform X2 [Phymastichus coffea]|uniref:cap-specific mRNA (nucleoside-2'-O-)-methyltransferase 1 isoform X2 n=1 Tax=Phymastichus coffea TaxID=108790 RepID=UPI00273C3764|nr:cap-specific mRNA (nucleoside-2'-O-)-methyltransferase 1 isoform X2 [Phymastichus coffea]
MSKRNMASRLTDTSDSSSEDESGNEYHSNKRKFDDSFNDSSDDQSSKLPRFNRFDNYYNKEVKEEDKEDKDDKTGFETHNITNFYDKTDSNRSATESEKASSSYYHESSASGNNSSISHSKSSSVLNKSNINLKDVQNKKPSTGGSSMAERYMKKFGHKEGLGLGKDLQGISIPVSASTQKGRRGFGFTLEDLEQAHIEFKPEDEIVNVQEEITWLSNKYTKLPSDEEINSWKSKRNIGVRKETIDGETTFCDELVVKGVIKSKSVFDRLDKNEMREARTRSNPFETIRGSIFLNRAAVKMANMDRACNFIFTQPDKYDSSNELLYFADVCAGPGGFSEYVLWRKKWRAKGFGFTLKGDNDFKLHDFHAGPPETFHPFYGVKDDGDVYDPDNQLSFRDLIMNQTKHEGVHFMMADGGFSVEGQENIQEILSKQLYLCQCLVALMIVRTGGHFVTKLFDLFTPFSASLVYIVYRCFKKISIFKPNTSRPANSERYLICQGKLPYINHIIDYLFESNKILCKNNHAKDILELVPTDILTSDSDFFEYLKNSNEVLGQRQIIGLKKIAAYTEDKTLQEIRQKEMREECLKYWKIPDEARKIPRQTDASSKAKAILGGSHGILNKNAFKDAMKLDKENISNTILMNENDWLCTPCFSGEDDSGMTEDKTATFFLSMGRSQIYKYNKDYWELIKNFKVELPRDTLVYAEAVMEMKKESRSMTKTYGFHILDAFNLGSENISHEYFDERYGIYVRTCTTINSIIL